MKEITMREMRCGAHGWEETGTKKFRLVSRWIKVRWNYNPTKRNSLWDYVMDEDGNRSYQDGFNPENGLFLDYFKWNGRTYAVEQFLAYGNPFWNPVTYDFKDENRYPHWLSGYDETNYYHPISVEFDEYMERVRVFEEV